MTDTLRETENYILLFATWKEAHEALCNAYANGDVQSARSLGQEMQRIASKLDAWDLHSWAQAVRNDLVQAILETEKRSSAA